MLLPIKPICSASKCAVMAQALFSFSIAKVLKIKLYLILKLQFLLIIGIRSWSAFQITYQMRLVLLNKEIQRQIRLAEDIISYALANKIPNPVRFAKSTFIPNFDLSTLQKAVKENKAAKPKINRDFFFQFNDYIKSKEQSVAASTLQVFKNLKVILQSFESYRRKAINFDDIDYNFYEEFLNYLSFEHIHQNKKEILKGLKQTQLEKVLSN